MLEARLDMASTLKRVIEAVKELVNDANFEATDEGLNLQAMDNSHVALVAVNIKADGFSKYRCDRPVTLGVNMNSLQKVLKCSKDDDTLTLKSTDDADLLTLTYEAKNSDRISAYDMKLMDIDAESLTIPDTEYEACVTMSASEFARICRDLSGLGESVKIEVTKEGVRFVSEGEAANGQVLLKQTEAARRAYAEVGKPSQDDEVEEGSSKKKKSKTKVKTEDGEPMEDVEEDDAGDAEDAVDGEVEAVASDVEASDEEEIVTKKRKKSQTNGKVAKRAKKEDDGEGAGVGVRIEMNSAVTLTFSLKYLINFAKSSPLSSVVQLMMSADVPLLCAYTFEQGYIRYYLAPKIGDD